MGHVVSSRLAAPAPGIQPLFVVLLIGLLLGCTAAPPVGHVSTLAGSVDSNGNADGTGAAAMFDAPVRIALNSAGTRALVTDDIAIRSIDLTTNTVTTVAGNSLLYGFEDGVGTAAKFYFPVGLAFAGTRALIADMGGMTIRSIDLTTSAVTTVAGKYTLYGHDDGVGTAARFNNPVGVTIDSAGTRALVADTNNHAIRSIDLTTNTVTTVVGTQSSGHDDGVGTAASFISPTGIAVNAAGTRALVADADNHAIRSIDLTTYTVTTVAGNYALNGGPPNNNGHVDGVGTSASFFYPAGVALDSEGVFALVVDRANHAIRYIDLTTNTVTTVAGSPTQSRGYADGAGTVATFNNPNGIALDATGTFALVTDTGNSVIRYVGLRADMASSSATATSTESATSTSSSSATATSSSTSTSTSTASATPTPSESSPLVAITADVSLSFTLSAAHVSAAEASRPSVGCTTRKVKAGDDEDEDGDAYEGSLVASAVLVVTGDDPATVASVKALVKLLPGSTLSGFRVALYADRTHNGRRGPGQMLGAPITISSFDGTLSPDDFSWVTLDASANAWGTLPPRTHFWVGFLPGLTVSPAAKSGIQLGSIKVGPHHKHPRVPVGSDVALFQATTLFTARDNDDSSHGCASRKALRWLTSVEDWTSVNEARVRYFGPKRGHAISDKRRFGVLLLGQAV